MKKCRPIMTVDMG
jgi:hypothetical protein